MGEFADMAIDEMLSMDEYELQHPEECDDTSGIFRRDRRRNKVLKCSVCGARPLFWLQEGNLWYLGDFDEDNDEVRHVCKLKERFNRVRL